MHKAGTARFGKLNHITFFITHEITRCQYSSHGLPDYCCLRSCQSSSAIFPNQIHSELFTGSIVSSDNITPFLWHRNRKTKLIPALSFWHSLCKRQRVPLQMNTDGGTEMQFSTVVKSQKNRLLLFTSRKISALTTK